MSHLYRSLALVLTVLGAPLVGRAQVEDVGRPSIAIGPSGQVAIAHEVKHNGEWKGAVQLYSPSGSPIGPTHLFVGESCSGIDIWTSDFIENIELAFNQDGVLLVLMQHTGDLSLGGDFLISSEATLGAIDPQGNQLDLNDQPCTQYKLIFVGGGEQDRPRMAQADNGWIFVAVDGFINGANLRNVGIKVLDANLNELAAELIPHADEQSTQAFHMFPDIAIGGTLVGAAWQRCPIVDQQGNANECDVEVQFTRIANNNLEGVGGNQVVNSGDPAGTVNLWPAIATNASGRSVIAWADTRTGLAGDIFAQIFQDGQKVGDNIQVSASEGDIRRRPEVAIRNDGSFMVVWGDSSSVGFRARGAQFGPTGKTTMPPFILSSNPDSQSGLPDVATDGSRYLYTYIASTGGTPEVFSNAFTATANEPKEQPEKGVSTLSVYPSPFGNRLNLSFTLAEASEASLDVYDVLGRHVGAIASGLMTDGYHELRFESADLPNGIYVVRLATTDSQIIRTVVKSE